MIFVDTSVWVSFFRGNDRGLGEALARLLDEDQVALAAPVRIEILAGAPREREQQLRKVLSALPTSYPERSTWALVETWIAEAVRKGQRFGMGDLLIAAISAERQATIWSLDSDFVRMAKLGWIELAAPAV